ncbi:MAG: xylulokinase [bacterium]|nr:xylulokinase [bacterium]
MKTLLGIDIGTSSTKSVVLDLSGNLLAVSQKEYAIDSPKPGWAEQHPETWWGAVKETVRSVVSHSGVNPRRIAGIGLSGQMHGTVLLDKENRLLRPAIIWADRRTAKQCDAVVAALGKDRLRELAGNSLSPGFLAATLLWLKENESQTFSRIHTVLLPKDYVRFRLTGKLGTEVTDASSSLLLDVKRRTWSGELCHLVGISREQLPPLHESQEIVGNLTGSAAEELGIVPSIPVVAGGGDQSMAAIGNGVVEEGIALSTIGTGGQLFTPTLTYKTDPELRIHSFCHAAPGMWHLMGAILSAGLSLKWFRERFCPGLAYAEIDGLAASVRPGSEGLIFLPYLLGERTPHLDPAARGCFIGLTIHHSLGHLARAIMEGVAFAMKDCLTLFQSLDVSLEKIIVSGGGAVSALWRQIQADVYGREVFTVNTREEAATGAAILAGVGVGLYPSIQDACASLIKLESSTPLDPDNAARYTELYEVYRSLYPVLKDSFHALSALEQSPL